MTIQEAIDLLKPLGKQLGCSINIEPPEIWIRQYRGIKDGSRVETDPWRVFVCEGPVQSYEGATLEAAVRAALARHEAATPSIAESQAYANELEILGLPVVD